MKYSKTVRNLSTLGKVLNWLLLIPFVLFDKYALQYTFRKHILWRWGWSEFSIFLFLWFCHWGEQDGEFPSFCVSFRRMINCQFCLLAFNTPPALLTGTKTMHFQSCHFLPIFVVYYFGSPQPKLAEIAFANFPQTILFSR